MFVFCEENNFTLRKSLLPPWAVPSDCLVRSLGFGNARIENVIEGKLSLTHVRSHPFTGCNDKHHTMYIFTSDAWLHVLVVNAAINVV